MENSREKNQFSSSVIRVQHFDDEYYWDHYDENLPSETISDFDTDRSNCYGFCSEELESEKQKVALLSEMLKNFLTKKNYSRYEQTCSDEKYEKELQKNVELKSILNELELNNSFLLKRNNALEEALSSEQRLHESVLKKLSTCQAHIESLQQKLENCKKTIKLGHQRIVELEKEVVDYSSSSESVSKRLDGCEDITKYLKLQLETLLQKLKASRSENDFLNEKLSTLSKKLDNYQNENECLTNQLQSSITVIGSTKAELSWTYMKISKYEAALSSCYLFNWDLMTKLSAKNSLTQNQLESECCFNLISYPSDDKQMLEIDEGPKHDD